MAKSLITPESLSIITHGGMPVVTTAVLAQLYGTDVVRIQQNHSRNANRFIEGKHFHKLEGDQLSHFKKSLTISKIVSGIPAQTRNLILWTERGAARHAKMLETDQAWEVFEKLEDCYFSAMKKSLPVDLPSIDVRTLLLTGQSDPKIPIPSSVANAIERKAWDMAHEAFGLCREHLYRRVAYSASNDYPTPFVDEQKALRVVDAGGLGEALAHEWATQIKFMKISVEFYAKGINKEVSQLLDRLSQLESESLSDSSKVK